MVSILNTIETGHEDVIHDAEMDYYGLRLATCSSDQSVRIYNVKNGTHTLVADLRGHQGPVWQISWAHPKFGNLLASCSYDRRVIIWKESNDWFKFYEYSNHDSSVNSVAWAPHQFGLILACGSLDGTISILTYIQETNTWESKRIMGAHTSGCNAVSWYPATTNIAALNSDTNRSTPTKRLASGGCDNLIKTWKEEADQWVEEAKIEVHSDWVRDVAWAPSVGLTKNMIASCSQDRQVIVSTSDDFINWKSTVLNTFDDVVWSVNWSLTANILAVSGADNKVSLWKVDPEGQWICISEVIKGQGEITN